MISKKRIIAPSILSADFGNIGNAVSLIEQAGGDWIHLDVMDGVFVPPITFGAQMLQSIRRLTNLTLDVHLMTMKPGNHLNAFVEAGADRFTFHIEAEVHSHRLIKEINDLGISSGIAIVPSTPVSAIEELLDVVDQVLVMTVNPGWGGQTMITKALEKVRRLRKIQLEEGGSFLICIDGGFKLENSGEIWDSGVDAAVMGSAFFDAKNPEKILDKCRLK
ncbi:Ribulose-phosphate 3-epimerase [Olavius algarvensis spirochete endosymbiont]|uniref:ribulose-phosphate 3-epimerase n=1 Tax=Olavius algarvensis spirochete endosymbiont TaxID=260710 RepID=UPI000F110507|nr:MAG: Ribulose-phosphate 3-epimerase (EC 5.1.3.1) [Olavius algarvensis spirochete endosymbiont]VDB00315.1 Ribulose-phosphate 3-epimerase [Olavius algarvensis spirochete endosymbiont]